MASASRQKKGSLGHSEPMQETVSRALPEQLTAEALGARPKQPKPSQKASTAAAYSKTSNKWWPAFLKDAGWEAADKSNFLDADGKPRDGIFQQLFIWLYEKDVTKGVFKPMLAWAQSSLNDQLAARLLPHRPDYVCKLPGIRERKDEIFKNTRQLHMEHMTDLQAAVESDIGFDGMVKMVTRCYRLRLPETRGMFTMQSLYELRATHQQARTRAHKPAYPATWLTLQPGDLELTPRPLRPSSRQRATMTCATKCLRTCSCARLGR